MTPYKLIIFDWDGTLMDSAAKIVSCMQLAAQHTQLSVPSAEDVRHIIGISLKPAIAQLFDMHLEKHASILDSVVNAYKKAYLEQDQTPCPLFEGANHLLTTLKNGNQAMAVATGKARRGLQRAWDNTDTQHYFIDSRCADEAESKPSPDMLKQLLQSQNIDANEALMIGDTTYDMQMAEAIGMDRVAVSYGVHNEIALAKHTPKHTAQTVSSLKDYLLSISASR